MNKQQLNNLVTLAPIIKAVAEGKQIQWSFITKNRWYDVKNTLSFDFLNVNLDVYVYRVKPEGKVTIRSFYEDGGGLGGVYPSIDTLKYKQYAKCTHALKITQVEGEEPVAEFIRLRTTDVE